MGKKSRQTRRPILSVKLKIVLTYAIAYLVLIGVLVTTLYLTRWLEAGQSHLEQISRLEETILELRRSEKNLFLYKDEKWGRLALSLVEEAQGDLAKQRHFLESVASRSEIDGFEKDLQKYKKAISDYLSATVPEGGPVAKSARQRIRKHGSSLASFVEAAAELERKKIDKTIEIVNRLQLGLALFIGLGMLGFGAFVLVRIIHPLKLLQDYTHKIGQGHFEEIEKPPAEKELYDAFLALNRMSRELKKREEQLLRSRHLASLGTLLAGVAHEVNNPLSNIRSTCEILLEDVGRADEEFQRQNLETIVEEVDRAATIIRDLLELSRKRTFMKEWLDLEDLVNRTVKLMQDQIPPSIELVVNVGGNEKIFADKQKMQQALMNVISNAVEAIEGEGKVVIEAQDVVDGMVDIVIMDTGAGMEEETVHRVFDPFFSTKDVGKGTGLGLFITHDIVERHNGRILVQSTPGKGTTFTIRIPVEESAP